MIPTLPDDSVGVYPTPAPSPAPSSTPSWPTGGNDEKTQEEELPNVWEDAPQVEDEQQGEDIPPNPW